MADFYTYLRGSGNLKNMPPIEIERRSEDAFVVYDKKTNRLDRIAGEFYGDDTLWRIILWANPKYYYEFDIPDGTSIRVPQPKIDVVQEVIEKIINTRDYS